jgi:hypothetical protein
MKRFCLPVLFALLFFSSVLSTPPAHADTYQNVVIALGDSNSYELYGMADSGDFVTSSLGGCSVPGQICYHLYIDGQVSTSTLTPPSLAYDDGTICSGPDQFPVVCNGDREAFVVLGLGGNPSTLIAGTSSDLSVVKTGDFGFISPIMDSQGDIVFDDGNNFEEYIDLTSRLDVTPEPSTIILFGTGILGFAGVVRRKLSTAR